MKICQFRAAYPQITDLVFNEDQNVLTSTFMEIIVRVTIIGNSNLYTY